MYEIYSPRNHPERSRDVILRRVSTGTEYLPRKDVISVSARTVLQEADSISRETHLAPNEPIGTRHLAAAYFFRNPPGHDRQLHIEWGFETETWRRAFAEFIGRQYAAEAGEWKQLLSGYVATEPVQTAMPGAVLGTYMFDPPAIRVLRTLQFPAIAASSPLPTSDALLNPLVPVLSEPA